jgi:hypothetical protein
MRRIITLALLLLAWPASAHEYWIEPKTYLFAPQENITAGLFNGQNFQGFEGSYFEKNFRRFELALGDRAERVLGRTGDKPALAMAPLGEGLHVATYESAGDTVFYNDFEVFKKFVNHKGFAWALARHAERGLPQERFVEYYTRHAKSLLAVGHGKGEDRPFGLETEFVALKNPYTDDVSAGMPVRVLYKGMPRANGQVELFDKDAAGMVNVAMFQIGADGVALLPVVRGHSYLADAVVLREPAAGTKAAERGAVWESLWAALTFAVP